MFPWKTLLQVLGVVVLVWFGVSTILVLLGFSLVWVFVGLWELFLHLVPLVSLVAIVAGTWLLYHHKTGTEQ